MKRFLVILCLALYILTATECNQLLKLPMLAEHFTEHRALDNRLSFSDFLYMHYTGHDLNDNDEDRDLKLPFKSHNASSSVSFLSVPSQPGTLSLNLMPVVIENTEAYKPLNFQSFYLSSIWQPPKSR